MIESCTRAVIRFRWYAIACWLGVVIVGGIWASQLGGLLSVSLEVPGTSSQHADAILAQHLDNNPDGTFTVVFEAPNPTEATVDALKDRLASAAHAIPDAHAMRLTIAGDVVYGNIATPYGLQKASGYTAAVRKALASAGSPEAYVTGEPAIQNDLTPLLATDLHRGELIALPVVLILLALTLGISLALAVPVIFAACSISATLGIVYLLAHRFTMVSYIPNLVELIGLGLAVDYSLLIVHRFREELSNRDDVEDAIVRTMTTAGRSVLFSGAAVAAGLCLICIIPVPFIRSVGVAGLLVPVLSMVATLTLQPALLFALGRRGMRTVAFQGSLGREPTDGAWAKFARGIVRHRFVVLGGAIVLVGLAASPLADLQLTPGSIFAIPRSTPSARGESLLLNSIGAGAMTPIQVVIDGGAPRKATSPAATQAMNRLMDEVADDPEVFLVEYGTAPPWVDSSGRYRLVTVGGRHEFGSEVSQRLVEQLRDKFIPEARFPSGTRLYTGGAPSEGVDFLTRVYGYFPWLILGVLALTYLMLARAFRSLVLPALAVVLNIASVAAAYGMLVVIFRFGVGADVLGLYRVSQIEGWIPVFLFAVLFGISMDYEVFLVSRMREAFDAGADTETAIVTGLERTGRVVSAAALIMVATFCGFLAGSIADLQEFGTGLVLGVLFDATVVRFLLLPTAMAILGRANWLLPKWRISERGEEGIALQGS